jgi:hypothetical protein
MERPRIASIDVLAAGSREPDFMIHVAAAVTT